MEDAKYGELRCNVELQTSEKKARCKIMLASIQNS